MQAVSARQLILLLQQIAWICKRLATTSAGPRGDEGWGTWAPAQSELTQGDNASLQRGKLEKSGSALNLKYNGHQKTRITALQSERWGLKTLHYGPLFSSIFDNLRKKPCAFVTFALSWDWGSTINIITPVGQASTCGRVLALSLTPSAPKQWKLDVKFLSARDSYWRNPRKRKYRVCSNIKARRSVHWLAQCQAKWPRGCKEFQHPARIESKLLDLLQLTLTTKP